MTAVLAFPPLWFAAAALVVLLVMVPCARWLDGQWSHTAARVTTPEPAPEQAPVPVTPARPVTVVAQRLDLPAEAA